MSQSLIPLEKIDAIIQIDAALMVFGLVTGTWIMSKLHALRTPADRDFGLGKMFKNLLSHAGLGFILFGSFSLLHRLMPFGGAILERLLTIIGLATVASGTVIVIKGSRILVTLYFSVSHKKVPFPVLLINLFTLLFSLLLVGWICSEIFSIRLGPLLATSTIFSLVLGLALQDTLGNLFAGVALQFDKPYELGDWIEVDSGGQKWVGKVFEISWRATVLIAFTEESITVPNRIMGQAQILNFSTKNHPIMRSQVFRIPFHNDVLGVKKILIDSARQIPAIRKKPSPFVLVSETTESWISFKLAYFIDNYGQQYLIGDQVLMECLKKLSEAKIELAGNQLKVELKNKMELQKTSFS